MADEYYSGAYTGAEIDAGIAAANAAAPQATTYTKDEVDGLLDGKADKSTTYTKNEVDSLLSAGKYFENKMFSGTTDMGDIFTYTIPANKIVRITAQMMYTNSHPKSLEVVSVLSNTNFVCDSVTTENQTTINCLTVSAIIGPRGAANTVKVRGSWFTNGNNNVSIFVETLN